MFWLKVIFLEAVPYVVIVVLNLSILKTLIRSKKFRQTFQVRRKDNKACTLRHAPLKKQVSLSAETGKRKKCPYVAEEFPWD